MGGQTQRANHPIHQESASTVTIPTSSAVSDEACANQMDRQDRFQDKFEDDGNPNNDKGNEESWTNSFKNREPC